MSEGQDAHGVTNKSSSQVPHLPFIADAGFRRSEHPLRADILLWFIQIRWYATNDSCCQSIWRGGSLGAFSVHTQKVDVGGRLIEVTVGHIYLYPHLPATYDYVPWNVIRNIIDHAGISAPTLIDVGANVGDSLAHFRRFSDGKAICIEPANNFFEVLSRNAQLFSNVELINSLLVPDDLIGKVSFSGNEQTGATRSTNGDVEAWRGSYITFGQILSRESGPVIIKTDTDGFDADIVGAALPYLKGQADIPLVYFEGPSEDQMRASDVEKYVSVCEELISAGYGLLFLTNVGMPYIYTQATGGASAAFSALETGYQRGMALCHYYDIIAIRLDVVSPQASLAIVWGDELFSRS